jgi:hypothetical protein
MRGAKRFRPPLAVVTSKSGRPSKRCLINRDKGGELTTRILTFPRDTLHLSFPGGAHHRIVVRGRVGKRRSVPAAPQVIAPECRFLPTSSNKLQPAPRRVN